MSVCEVGLNTQGCEHPPGIRSTGGIGEPDGLPAVRSRCYQFGQRACRSCSDIERHQLGGRYRRVRVCNDCQEQNRG